MNSTTFSNYTARSCLPVWDRSDPFNAPNQAQCRLAVNQMCANASGVTGFFNPGGARDVIAAQCGIYAYGEIDSYYRSALAICGRILDLMGLAKYNETTKTIYLFNSIACGVEISTTQLPISVVTTALTTIAEWINTTLTTISMSPFTASSSSSSSSSPTESALETETVAATTATTTVATTTTSTIARTTTSLVSTITNLIASTIAATERPVNSEASSSVFWQTPSGIIAIVAIVVFCLILMTVAFFATRTSHRSVSLTPREARPLPPQPVPTADDVARAMLRITAFDRVAGPDDDYAFIQDIDETEVDAAQGVYDNRNGETGELEDGPVIYELARNEPGDEHHEA